MFLVVKLQLHQLGDDPSLWKVCVCGGGGGGSARVNVTEIVAQFCAHIFSHLY